MQEFWATVFIHKSSIRFTINKKKVSFDVEIFKEILLFFLKIPRHEFEDLQMEHDILSIIKDLGHSSDIIYLTDEDFMFQIENKEAKKTNKMSYPRFTKIIIDYFMSKDQSILRRNKMFWHTTRDETMFTSMRCISRHEATQVYGTILPKELTNQAMLESKAYNAYYAFASGEKSPKANADEGTSTILGVLDVPKYEYESEKGSWGDSGEEDEYDENGSTKQEDEKYSDQIVCTPPDYDDEKIHDEKILMMKKGMEEEEEDEVTKEFYKNVNVNLGNKDTKKTDADQGGSSKQNVSQELGFKQVEEDDHVTLTPVLEK
nr:hypothetical protein [Tanacetum cinerariifolium]